MLGKPSAGLVPGYLFLSIRLRLVMKGFHMLEDRASYRKQNFALKCTRPNRLNSRVKAHAPLNLVSTLGELLFPSIKPLLLFRRRPTQNLL